MVGTSYKLPDLMATDLGAQGGEALVHRRQRNLLACSGGLCTESIQALVGQQQMGQAAQMQVSQDSIPVQHLVIAEPQVLVQLFEQHLDHPTHLVDRHDLAGPQTACIGTAGRSRRPRLAAHFAPYCPDDNRIDRCVWRELHANVTRNNTCGSMSKLMAEDHLNWLTALKAAAVIR